MSFGQGWLVPCLCARLAHDAVEDRKSDWHFTTGTPSSARPMTSSPKSTGSGRSRRGCQRPGAALLSGLLFSLSALALYFSMFWGWASGAGSPPNAEMLYWASRIALAVSGIAFVGAVALAVLGLKKPK